jgi:hypothetical protein
MPRMELVDFEEIFHNDAHAKVIPCTEGLTSNTQVAQYIKDAFTDGSHMSFKASCDCGKVTGNFFIGTRCSECNSEVKSKFIDDLSYNLWIPLPSFAPPILQPIAYNVIKRWLGTVNGCSVLSTLLGGDGELPEDLLKWYKPGWHGFHNDFDRVMQYFLTEYKPLQRASSAARNENIPEFLTKYRTVLFTTKIPILNSTLHLMTRNGDLHYLDPSAKQIVELIKNVSVAEYQYSHGVKPENYINDSLADIYEIYQDYIMKVLRLRLVGSPAKRGFIRQVAAGFRSSWSFRGVITPICELHDGDELHIPWKIAVVCLKIEILNLLMSRQGLTLDAALRKQGNAELQYDKDIADILEVLIAECPYKGLPVLFDRNPSMQLGAIQLLFVTKVLPDSNSIGLSPLILTAPKRY